MLAKYGQRLEGIFKWRRFANLASLGMKLRKDRLRLHNRDQRSP